MKGETWILLGIKGLSMANTSFIKVFSGEIRESNHLHNKWYTNFTRNMILFLIVKMYFNRYAFQRPISEVTLVLFFLYIWSIVPASPVRRSRQFYFCPLNGIPWKGSNMPVHLKDSMDAREGSRQKKCFEINSFRLPEYGSAFFCYDKKKKKKKKKKKILPPSKT